MASPSENKSQIQDVQITLHWCVSSQYSQPVAHIPRLDMSRSHRILWLLEELNVPYKLKTYKRGADRLAPPQLKEVHPLGKSPILTIEGESLSQPLVLAESGAIVEYLCDHYGSWMIPKRYQDGKEGRVGGETISWVRDRMLMHYAEGSLMTLLITMLVKESIKDAPVPFFIKPITKAIAARISSSHLEPNFKTHFEFLENQLATSPDGGEYFCGKDITGADIIMIFPLEAARGKAGLTKDKYPRLNAYVNRVLERPAYKRAVEKIKNSEGDYKSVEQW